MVRASDGSAPAGASELQGSGTKACLCQENCLQPQPGEGSKDGGAGAPTVVQGQPGLELCLWVLTRALANRPLWLGGPLERLYGPMAKEKEYLALCSLGSV